MQTEINGVKIYYERQGGSDKKPVLVLHGWGASVDAVRPIMNQLEKLGYEAIALDFPGMGKSEAPNEPWGVPEYAAMTEAFIKELGIRGCDVVCHSFGGRVTIYLASHDPKLFSRLILVDAAGIRKKRTLAYYIRTWSYKLGKKLSRIALFDRLFKISERQKNAGSEDYRALSGVMRATFVKVVNLDLDPLLPDIQNETLLIWGSLDDATPLYMAQRMEKRIKNSGLAVIEGAGHFSYADNYPHFCAILSAFMQ
ncbi:MAG: alpha/beta hydrolase [Clostridia bacterium]|nr:alpha/beta hydrolase [Clostridia bacterium]